MTSVFPQWPAEECKRCDGFERPKAGDAYTKNLRSCTLCLVAAGAADLDLVSKLDRLLPPAGEWFTVPA